MVYGITKPLFTAPMQTNLSYNNNNIYMKKQFWPFENYLCYKNKTFQTVCEGNCLQNNNSTLAHDVNASKIFYVLFCKNILPYIIKYLKATLFMERCDTKR